MRISNYLYCSSLPNSTFSLLGHGYSGAIDKVPNVLATALLENKGEDAEAALSFLPETEKSKLTSRGYLTSLSSEEERNLVISISGELHLNDLQNTPTGFMFVPAYTCNLRCPYCFQPHEYHKGVGKYGSILSESHVDAGFKIIEELGAPGSIGRHLGLLEPKKAGEELGEPFSQIGLFGGEPLSSSTRSIVQYIVQEAQKRQMTVTAITNGVELDLFTDLLGKDGLCELQITLDGMSGVHDKRRVGPGFRETFERISDNITLALSLDAQVSLRMNIDSVNAADLESLNDYCDERGWSANPLFRAHAASVSQEGSYKNTSSRSQLVEQTMDLTQRKSSIFHSYERAAKGHIDACLFGEGYPFKSVSNCSAETGLLMFDPIGDVYSCWEEIGEKEKRVATYDDAGLNFINDRAKEWISRFPGAIEECSKCAYALIHKAGCGKHAHTNSSTIYASACEEFKEYFPRTLAKAYDELEATLNNRSIQFEANVANYNKQNHRVIEIKEIANG